MPRSSPAARSRKAGHGEIPSVVLTLDGVRTGIDCEPVCLTVSKGETLTLFGSDAAALSRLFDTVAGFAPLLGGRVLVGGQDVSTLGAGRRGLALVSARDPLFDHLDVRANLAFPLRARGKGRAEIAEAMGRMLALFGLDGLDTYRPVRLSAEQNLRVRVARALLTEPAILLLDEPLAGLDGQAVRRVSALFATLSRALDMTVLQTMSRREDALRSGGPIAVFEGASLLQCEKADRLYEHPASAQVAVAFGGANALTGQVLEIADDVARIHLACGAVAEAVASERLEVGQACLLCIRPDRIAPFFGVQTLGLEDDLPPLQGTLAQSLHLGDHIHIRVRLADGSEIELNRPPLQARQIPAQGAPVQLAWPTAHAMAFPLEPDLY